jgi:hypothetical protein
MVLMKVVHIGTLDKLLESDDLTRYKNIAIKSNQLDLNVIYQVNPTMLWH